MGSVLLLKNDHYHLWRYLTVVEYTSVFLLTLLSTQF
jgi:hypothetical protein